MESLAEIIATLVSALIELAVWAIAGLYVALRAIFSESDREKLRREWRSGWKGKASLVFSAAMWTSLMAITAYLWLPVLV